MYAIKQARLQWLAEKGSDMHKKTTYIIKSEKWMCEIWNFTFYKSLQIFNYQSVLRIAYNLSLLFCSLIKVLREGEEKEKTELLQITGEWVSQRAYFISCFKQNINSIDFRPNFRFFFFAPNFQFKSNNW